jgi:predicted small secreted protein
MKKVIIVLLAMFAVAACNTFEGFGKDVQKAGETIEGAAKKK